MANGIIIIDKPAGWTSMDVCAKLRGILKTKKVGHAGTLDPMATGVLPVFVGQATRAVSFAESGDKEYVAVSTDTGCFVYTNTTARTHRIAAELMDCGIDVGAVNKTLFRTKSAVRLAMEARMVADMELYDNGRVVVMSIPLSLCRELHATEADIEELSSLAALVQGTDCGITLRELKPGRVKISLRTGPRVDACAVCRVLGGGGHKAAAGATVEGTMDEVKAGILAAYREVVG